MIYTVGQVAKLVGKSSETIRRWVDEFGEFMSDRVKPEPGEYRLFTEDDVRICAYISQSRDININTQDIRDGLEKGERADPRNSLSTVSKQTGEVQSSLRREIRGLQTQIEQLEGKLLKRDANIELLKEQLRDAQMEIAKLNQQIGRLKDV